MGQQNSADEQRKANRIPYTNYSHLRDSDRYEKEDSLSPMKQGITVVNPQPDSKWRPSKPPELQKLEKIHRFWPILKSSLESMPPTERITNGLDYKHALQMCQRYQEHLGESAKIVATEQRALASRLRDIEMFSAGVAQELIRREERLQRVSLYLQKVSEVEKTLESIQESLAHCIPLAQSFNNLLPEEHKLETFLLKPRTPSPEPEGEPALLEPEGEPALLEPEPVLNSEEEPANFKLEPVPYLEGEPTNLKLEPVQDLGVAEIEVLADSNEAMKLELEPALNPELTTIRSEPPESVSDLGESEKLELELNSKELVNDMRKIEVDGKELMEGEKRTDCEKNESPIGVEGEACKELMEGGKRTGVEGEDGKELMEGGKRSSHEESESAVGVEGKSEGERNEDVEGEDGGKEGNDDGEEEKSNMSGGSDLSSEGGFVSCEEEEVVNNINEKDEGQKGIQDGEVTTSSTNQRQD